MKGLKEITKDLEVSMNSMQLLLTHVEEIRKSKPENDTKAIGLISDMIYCVIYCGEYTEEVQNTLEELIPVEYLPF